MTALELLQSVQFVTIKGKRLALLDAENWEALIEWLEDIEDNEIAKQALQELKNAGGDREKAGWLKWDNIKEEI